MEHRFGKEDTATAYLVSFLNLLEQVASKFILLLNITFFQPFNSPRVTKLKLLRTIIISI